MLKYYTRCFATTSSFFIHLEKTTYITTINMAGSTFYNANQAVSQAAYQPPAYIFFLKASGLSLFGEELPHNVTSNPDLYHPEQDWADEANKRIAGMCSKAEIQKHSVLSAEQANSLRKKGSARRAQRVQRRMQAKDDNQSAAALAQLADPEAGSEDPEHLMVIFGL